MFHTINVVIITILIIINTVIFRCVIDLAQLTSRWLHVGQVFFFSFFVDQGSRGLNKNAKNKIAGLIFNNHFQKHVEVNSGRI